MFPKIRQRIFIGVAIVIGALAWYPIAGLLRAADGSTGLSLVSARVGLPLAIVWVLLSGLPIFALGLVASVIGNPLSGVFAVSASLCILAGIGGSVDGWFFRAHLPGDYGLLIVETMIWQTGVVIMLTVIQTLRSPMRARWPALAYDDHLGMDTHVRWPATEAIIAGLICAAVSAGLAYFMLRTSNTSQVVFSLMAAFGIGGMVAHLIFPQTNPVGILLSPCLIAVGTYTYMLFGYGGTDEILAAWYAQRLPGLALGLPIHYISAGVAGCTAGIGISQGLEVARDRALSA